MVLLLRLPRIKHSYTTIYSNINTTNIHYVVSVGHLVTTKQPLPSITNTTDDTFIIILLLFIIRHIHFIEWWRFLEQTRSGMWVTYCLWTDETVHINIMTTRSYSVSKRLSLMAWKKWWLVIALRNENKRVSTQIKNLKYFFFEF